MEYEKPKERRYKEVAKERQRGRPKGEIKAKERG